MQQPSVPAARFKPRSVVLPLLFSSLMLSGAPPFGDSARADDAAGKAAELEQLRTQIESLRRSLDTDRGEQSALRTRLKTSEQQIGTAKRTLRTITGQLKEIGRELDDLQRRRAEQQEFLSDQQHMLGRQVRASYALGRQSYVKLLLSQQNPAAVGRTVTYYDYLNRARSTQISAVSDGLAELRTVQQQIEVKKEKLQGLYESEQRNRADLEKSVAERRTVLAKLDKDIQGKEKRLKQLTGDEKRLEKLLAGLQRALETAPRDGRARQQPFAGLKGKLYWPVSGSISTRFGSSRQLGQMKWNGVLIAAREGDEVKSIAHGRVIFADWLRGFGLLMIIDHGGGYMSLYGHNQSLYRDVGDRVDEGEVIATVGTSGGRDTASLYFEVRHNGIPENPAHWCRNQRG